MAWEAMLTHSVGQLQMEPPPNMLVAPENSGFTGGVQKGLAQWLLTFDLDGEETAKSDAWRAWITRRVGSLNPFIGRDLFHSRPRIYQKSGFPGGFSGACSSWSQSIEAATGFGLLTLHGLPSGCVLNEGDLVDARWTATGSLERRSLARVVVGATASAGVATPKVYPPFPAATSGSAVAHLDNPGCVMRLTAAPSIGSRGAKKFIPMSVSAVEDWQP